MIQTLLFVNPVITLCNVISSFTKKKSMIYKGKSVPIQRKNKILIGFIHCRDNEKYQLTKDKINLVQQFMRLRVVVCANICMCCNFFNFFYCKEVKEKFITL